MIAPEYSNDGYDGRVTTAINIDRDRAFVVQLESELYGDVRAVVRQLAPRGLVVEMCFTPPLGTILLVRFESSRADFQESLAVRAEIVEHLRIPDHDGGVRWHGHPARVRMRLLEFVEPNTTLTPDLMH